MVRRLSDLRIDFAPREPQPSASRVVLATAASVAASLLVVAALVAIATTLAPSLRGYAHFRFSDYAKLTVIGVVIAGLGWPVVTRISSSPRWLYGIAAVAVTVVLWLPDVYLLVRGQPPKAVGVLMVLHVAIAVVTYTLMVLLAPAGREPARAARSGSSRSRW
jgi:Na+/proline symporter